MEEQNKLIAEFMGKNIITIDDIRANKNPYISSADGYTEEELQYHTSWDWLMPVVQKIGDDYYNTPFDETYSKLTEQYENIWTLEDTYNAVVEFIKEQNNEEKYYCENCFEEELEKPIEDEIGGVYCSDKCKVESKDYNQNK
jgi:hypothetical protein